MAEHWTEYGPWKEARQQEDAVRDAAFLIEREEICGITVLSMNWRHYLLLAGIGSPFICGGQPLPAHIPQFLWVLSPEFTTEPKRRNKFVASCRKLIYETACEAIGRYVEDTFQDAPEGTLTEKVPVASQLAFAVDALASEYGWSEERILSLPLKRAYQYLRCIALRHDDKSVFINRSDSERTRWLQKRKN